MRTVKIEIEESNDGRLRKVARTFPLTEVMALKVPVAGSGFLQIVGQLNQALDGVKAPAPKPVAAVKADAAPAAAEKKPVDRKSRKA